MGQYYLTVNLDKKEFLYPHKFNDGLKLVEFGSSGSGTMFGLAALLAEGNGRGGGDLHSESKLIGSWAGDRIVVVGDYADEGKFLTKEQIEKFKSENEDSEPNLYIYANKYFKDISEDIIFVLCENNWVRDHFLKEECYMAPAKEVQDKVREKYKETRCKYGN